MSHNRLEHEIVGAAAGAVAGGLAYLAVRGLFNLFTSPFRAVHNEVQRSETILRHSREVIITHERNEPRYNNVIDMGSAQEVQPYDHFDIDTMVKGNKVYENQQRRQQSMDNIQQAFWHAHGKQIHEETHAFFHSLDVQSKQPSRKKFLGLF
jgi:hypothetical protein